MHTHLCAFPHTTGPYHSPTPLHLPHPNMNDVNPHEDTWHGLAADQSAMSNTCASHWAQTCTCVLRSQMCPWMLRVHTTAPTSIPRHDVPSPCKGGPMSPIPVHALTHCMRPCEHTDNRHHVHLYTCMLHTWSFPTSKCLRTSPISLGKLFICLTYRHNGDSTCCCCTWSRMTRW